MTTLQVAAKLGMSEPGLRSWLNGNRQINLSDFIRLCEAVKADPRQMLFGAPYLSPEQRQVLGEAVAHILENDTAANPHYPPFVKGLQRDMKRRNK